MKFEWNESKYRANIKKHGLSFETAALVFDDSFLVSVPDERFGYGEERWMSIGLAKETIICVVYVIYEDNYGEEIIKIISARAATSSELRGYYLNRKSSGRIGCA